MSFINPMRASFSSITSARGPALLTPLDRPDDVLLIGAGEDPYAVLLGGEWSGEGFKASRSEHWDGLLIDGLTVEVDPSSAYDIQSGKISLSLVRRAGGFGVYFKLKEGSFAQTTLCPLAPWADDTTESPRLAFSRWRLVLVEGDERTEILSIDAGVSA